MEQQQHHRRNHNDEDQQDPLTRQMHTALNHSYPDLDPPLQENKNSLVRSSLMLSRSLAAFSNSNFLAASRISDSNRPIYPSSSCCVLNSGIASSWLVKSAYSAFRI